MPRAPESRLHLVVFRPPYEDSAQVAWNMYWAPPVLNLRMKVSAMLIALSATSLTFLCLVGEALGARRVREQAGIARQRQAEELSRMVGAYVDDALRGLANATEYIPFERLSIRATGAALQITLRQRPELNAAVILDDEGAPRVPVVTRPGDGEAAASRARGGGILHAHRPAMDEVLRRGRAIGEPFLGPHDEPMIVIAVRVPSQKPLALVAELSLEGMLAKPAELTSPEQVLTVLSPAGVVIASSHDHATLSAAELDVVQMARGHDTVARVHEQSLLIATGVSDLGWTLLVEEPEVTALAAGFNLRQSLTSCGLMLLVVVMATAVWSGKWIARPIECLALEARAIADGDYSRRLEVTKEGETATLAHAINHLVSELQTKQREFRRRQRELIERVERQAVALHSSHDQALRARRLTALGSLSAGLLHELNNPLAGILGLLTLLERSDLRGDDAAMLRDAREEVRRVEHVLSRLKQFVELETQAGKNLVDVQALVDGAVEACAAAANAHGVMVVVECPDPLPQVVVEQESALRAMCEILHNAIEASDVGARVCLTGDVVGDDVVRLAIDDEGTGIPAADRDRVFDPFFTTRAASGHVGMGLAIAHATVQAQHGKLMIHQRAPAGTRVEIFLPAAPRPAHIE